MKELEAITIPEVQGELYKSNFIKKHPSLEYQFKGANFLTENYAEHPNLRNFIKLEENEQKPSKMGIHREVYYYDDYVFKTPENSTAEMALMAQAEMPDVPIVRYIGAIKDLKTNKEYLIEPKGELFKEFYLISSKSPAKIKEFENMLKEFILGFTGKKEIPFEFNSDNLDKHLLVFSEKGNLVLKMTDVISLIKIEDNKEIDNFSKKYLLHLESRSELDSLSEDVKEKKLRIETKKEDLNKAIHGVKSPLAPIPMYIDSLEKMDANKKAYFIKSLKNHLEQMKSSEDSLFGKFDIVVRQLVKENEEENFANYEKKIISDYDRVTHLLSWVTEENYNNELLTEIRQLSLKICKEMNNSWDYVKDEYNIKKEDEESKS